MSKPQKWQSLYSILQKDFITDLERILIRTTTKTMDKCQAQLTGPARFTCIQDLNTKLNDLLLKFQRDLTSSLTHLENCIQTTATNEAHAQCIVKYRNQIQKDTLFLLDAARLRIN